MASYVLYPGDGVQTDWAVPFPKLSKTHVQVSVADVAVAFSWLNDSLIRVTPPVAIGSTLLVKRVTQKTPMTQFENTNNLTAENLSLAETQSLYIAEEASDAADIAVATADNNSTVASTALATANSASDAASAAVTTANAANETAADANTKADAATATANEAKTTADAAAASANIHVASDLPYDNDGTGLSATNVQQAIDLIAGATGLTEINTDNVVNTATEIPSSTLTGVLAWVKYTFDSIAAALGAKANSDDVATGLSAVSSSVTTGLATKADKSIPLLLSAANTDYPNATVFDPSTLKSGATTVVGTAASRNVGGANGVAGLDASGYLVGDGRNLTNLPIPAAPGDRVTTARMVYAGDASAYNQFYSISEPWAGAVATGAWSIGIASSDSSTYAINGLRMRYLQVYTPNAGWQTVAYA